jgi:hypothetical protein
MVLALELTEEEVLKCLKKVLKGVTIIPHIVPKYCADHPPPAVSCFCFCFASTFFHCFLLCEYFLSLLLLLILLLLIVCRIWGGISSIRSLLRATQLGQGLTRTLLDCLQLVSLQSSQFFLVLPAMNSSNMLNMCCAQFLELLVPPARGRGRMMLLPACLLPRSPIL